ncbi:MAG: gliding motility protein [Myxococcales bacterium]|nr:gliding motility protein [Myxococcales bacterium]MCB9713912.1 gliding motility protein [Myxococcales bacterium]
MVFIDMPRKEVTLKLVYYGPALSGKTTNLQQLHRRMQGYTDGELVTLNTRDDRTLFFDLLPLRLSVGGGLSIRFKLFTVPGQVIHNATRKIVLQGADGVAFIADSRVSQTRANNESFANLRANLNENGIAMSEIGTVIQLNKRDLPGIRSDEEVEKIRRRGSEPVYTAVALRGEGVAETFLGLASISWSKLDRRYQLEESFGVTHDEVMDQLATLLGRGGRRWS